MRRLPDEVLEEIIPLSEYISDDPEYEIPEGTSKWFYTCKNTRARYITYGENGYTGYPGYSGKWLFENHHDAKVVAEWIEAHGGEDQWEENWKAEKAEREQES